MSNWSILCDTAGDGSFSGDSVTDLVPTEGGLSTSEQWETGYFTPKRTNYATDTSLNVLYTHYTPNKRATLTFYTSFESVLKLTEWHQMACIEYSHQDPKWVVRPKDADGNVLTLGNNRYSFCIVVGLGFRNKAGDPTRIFVDVDLMCVGYK